MIKEKKSDSCLSGLRDQYKQKQNHYFILKLQKLNFSFVIFGICLYTLVPLY